MSRERLGNGWKMSDGILWGGSVFAIFFGQKEGKDAMKAPNH